MRLVAWTLAILCTITIVVSLVIILMSDQQTIPTNDPSSAPVFGSALSLRQAKETDTLDAHVKKILVPRVPGTKGNVEVRQYIVDTFKANNYYVELDEFTNSTPIGDVKFANIIADSNSDACRQLVLACHYDSKLMDGFLGATDSAVPCAMLLVLAEKFKDSFKKLSGEDPSKSLGLRFIFFDGEEAFVDWSSTDSLYGSRHLAEKWHKQPAPSQCPSSVFKSELNRIELFILLDLIGASDSSFVIYDMSLKTHYDAMRKYEQREFVTRGLSAESRHKETSFKSRYIPLSAIEDDHVPFLRRGVPILSLLSYPFPSVWHTIQDNYEAIDFPKTRRILHVLEQFISNYTKVLIDAPEESTNCNFIHRLLAAVPQNILQWIQCDRKCIREDNAVPIVPCYHIEPPRVRCCDNKL